MRLNILPAKTGLVWVKKGVQTFIKQPMALVGLFFMFMAVASIASVIPVIGSVLALVLLPAATLGLMAASLEASKGKFPMPLILASGFRAGKDRMRSMLILGALYALGFLLVMGVSSLFDGGAFAKLYLVGGKLNKEIMENSGFKSATLAALVFYLPLSLLFWHAPALVHWHGVTPSKALFFSWMACWRNMGAYMVFGMVWLAVFSLTGMVAIMLTSLLGAPGLAGAVMMGVMLVVVAMFFTSLYFTFLDSFTPDDEPTENAMRLN